jgi:hypothetical protein
MKMLQALYFSTRAQWWIASSMLLLIGTSCSRNDPASRIGAMNDSRIKQLANLYMAHQIRNSSNGPKDEAAFKAFIQKDMPARRLEMMRVDPAKTDDLFVSERDGQPFVIKYGQSGGIMSKAAVIFEKEGKDGTRQVAYTNGQVEEVDSAKYQELSQSGKQADGGTTVAK